MEEKAVPATFTVANPFDSGVGSLRQAIIDANLSGGADSIVFDSSFSTTQTITLTRGDLEIIDPLTITGPTSTVIISGDNSSRVFDINASSEVLMSNLIIRDGNSNHSGAGIRSSDTNLTLLDCTITLNSTVESGGGVRFENGIFSINSCEISQNVAGDFGGGVYCPDGEVVTFDTVITGNVATHGGGLAIIESDLVALSTSISKNKATEGGGIYGLDASLVIGKLVSAGSASKVSQNTADADGGGIYADNSNLYINYSQVGGYDGIASISLGNKAGNDGGGIYATNGTATLLFTDINHNEAKRNGGGIFASQTPLFLGDETIAGSGCTVSVNLAGDSMTPGNGGGIFSQDAGLTAYACELRVNSAFGDGGAIHFTIGLVALTDCQIIKNHAADQGAGMYAGDCTATIHGSSLDKSVFSTNKASGEGGGLFLHDGKLAITKTSMLANESLASSGGGLYLNKCEVDIGDDSTFSTNSAANDGGGIYGESSDLDIKDVVFDGKNQAVNGDGGAIYSTSTIVSIRDGSITNSIAFGRGGGICALSGSLTMIGTLTVPSVLMKENLAVSGGAIYSETTTTLVNCDLDSNRADFGSAVNIEGTSASVTIVDSKLHKNARISDPDSEGGGVRLVDISTSVLSSLSRTTMTDNTSSFGGGIAIRDGGLVEIADCTIQDHDYATRGAGIYVVDLAGVDSAVTVSRTTISGGSANVGGGMALVNVDAPIRVQDSTMWGNQAYGKGAFGGGVAIYDLTDEVEFYNCTISTNEAKHTTQDAKGAGFAIHGFDSTTFTGVVKIANSTIYLNAANIGGGIDLLNVPAGNVVLDSTIVAGNSAILKSGPTYGAGQDINFVPIPSGSTTLTINYCLLGVSDDGGFAFDKTLAGHNQFGDSSSLPASALDPELEALADNGGSTRTHRPIYTSTQVSPVIDMGRNKYALDWDQRTEPFNREVKVLPSSTGPVADIGAVELQYACVDAIDTYADNKNGKYANTHSRITSIVVTFNIAVDLPDDPEDAFKLTQLGSSATITLTAVQDGNVVTLRFPDMVDGKAVNVGLIESKDEYRSLADGNYQLTVLAANVLTLDGIELDGNGGGSGLNCDGTPGDNYATPGSGSGAMYRLFGDGADNNRAVTAMDYLQFIATYGSQGAVYDWNGDGQVTGVDYLAFKLQYGKTLVTPP